MLERQYGYSVTAVANDVVGGAGRGGIRRIKEWLANGGTVIGIEAGVEFLADAKVGLLATAREQLAVEQKVEPVKPDAGGLVPGKLLGSEAEFLQAMNSRKGSVGCCAGVFTPLKLNAGTNAAYFAGADQLPASGYLWEESRKQFAFKPLVMVQREGRGHVIGFTSDPNFRGYMDGMNVFSLNKVFRGVAHSR